jgi:predicted AAA+ superfamily ATPase
MVLLPYWRNKQGNKIDFIIKDKEEVIAIECKWKHTALRAEK